MPGQEAHVVARPADVMSPPAAAAATGTGGENFYPPTLSVAKGSREIKIPISKMALTGFALRPKRFHLFLPTFDRDNQNSSSNPQPSIEQIIYVRAVIQRNFLDERIAVLLKLQYRTGAHETIEHLRC